MVTQQKFNNCSKPDYYFTMYVHILLTFANNEFFKDLLINGMYYECLNILEQHLSKIKDCLASQSQFKAFKPTEAYLIKIYIVCLLKIEFLETRKLLRLDISKFSYNTASQLNKTYENTINGDTNDVQNLTEDLTKFFHAYRYDKSGNLNNIKNFINDFDYQYAGKKKKLISEYKNLGINASKANNNPIDQEQEYIDKMKKNPISLVNFNTYIIRLIYFFSVLISKIRSLQIKIDNYRDKYEVYNDLNNYKKKANNILNINSPLNKRSGINQNNSEEEILRKKELDNIIKSVFEIIKYSEFYEKFIYTVYYLNKNYKKEINESKSFEDIERMIFELIYSNENIYNLSLDENYFYIFHKINLIFKEFISKNFKKFIFTEIKTFDKHQNEEIKKLNKIYHTQKFENKSLNIDVSGFWEKNQDLFNDLNNTTPFNHFEISFAKILNIDDCNHPENYSNTDCLKQLNLKIEDLIMNEISSDRMKNKVLDNNLKENDSDNKSKLSKIKQGDILSTQKFLKDNKINEMKNYNNFKNDSSENNNNNISKNKIPSNTKQIVIDNEDIYFLKIAKCIMNALNNKDYEIKILLAIIKNLIEDKEDIREIQNNLYNLINLFFETFLNEEVKEGMCINRLFDKKYKELQKKFAQKNQKKLVDAAVTQKAKMPDMNFISSEIFYEILQTVLLIIEENPEFNQKLFLQINIFPFYETFSNYFDNVISPIKINLSLIEIQIKLDINKDYALENFDSVFNSM